MSWPDELELTLTGIAQGGAGVGRHEGRVVFAQGGLPGERVRVRLHERQRSFATGKVSAVLGAAPERVEPREVQAGHADWQHIEYGAQLAFKRQIVAEQLAHLGGLGEVPVAPTLPAPRAWGYRNSAALHGDEGGALGYYAPSSRRVIDRASDPLLEPVLNEALGLLREVLGGEGPLRWLRSLTLRANRRGEVLGIVEQPRARRQELVALAEAWMQRLPQLIGVVERRAGEALLGEAALYEELLGLRLRVSAGSFFQANAEQAEAMVRLVLEWLAPLEGASLVDAYCGVGAFTLPLAAAGARAVGIEEHGGAVADARENARALGLSASFLEGQVEALLPALEEPLDAALLDPPRRGAEATALEALAAKGPARIAYVSCHPGTLARDLRLLAGRGYAVRAVQPVDMFPQTHHVEAVVLLERE